MSLDAKKPKQLIEATFEIKKPTEIMTSLNEPQKSPAKRDDIILNKSKTESEFKMSRETTNRSIKLKSASSQKSTPKDTVCMSLNPAKTPSSKHLTSSSTVVKDKKTSNSLTTSALTRAPSKTLQAISSRHVDQKSIKVADENAFSSSIFMINVDSQDNSVSAKSAETSNPNSSRVSSARKSSEKITFSLSSKCKIFRDSSSLPSL